VRNLREEKGYTYSPQSQFTSWGDAGFYRFAADVRNEVTGAALTEIYKEFDTLRTNGAGGQELEDIKQYLRGVYAIRMASQDQLAIELTTVHLYELPRDYLETYQPKITAVTAGDVRASTAVLTTTDDSIIVIVGDWPKVKDQLTEFKNITFLDADGKKLSGPPAQ
jgi:zinc protease